MTKDTINILDKNIDLYLFDTIDSTNHFLYEKVLDFNNDVLVVAKEQTNGHGTNERNFISKKNLGIYFSLLINYVDEKQIKYITEKVAVSIYKVLLDKYNIDTRIKWVNDIYLNNKKLVGILIEDIFRDKFVSSVIGIGINLTDKPSYHAVGLNTDISKYVIIDKILSRFDEFNKTDFNKLMELYKAKSMVLGKMVYYHDKTYLAYDLDNNGYLVLKNDQETIKISWDEINIKESLL